jgi:hypothetical protein
MMATTATGGNLVSLIAPRSPQAGSGAVIRSQRPRQVSSEAGRAIEMLGHAIEYLSDEFALNCMDRILGTEPGLHPRLRAIELLKARNREIYLSCPEAPTIKERLQGWFHRAKAKGETVDSSPVLLARDNSHPGLTRAYKN